MAIWGLSIYFLFVLLKLASWVFAIKVSVQLFLNKYFEYKNNKINEGRGANVAAFFEKKAMRSVESSKLIEILLAIKGDSTYIQEYHINRALEKIKG